MRLFSLSREAFARPSAGFQENIPYEQSLAEQLQGRLLDLDFPAFALCLCRLLQALGYQDVHLAGRREWKGYNKPGGGGYDLEATLPGSLLPGSLLPSSLLPGSSSPRRLIAQVKQFDGLHVHQRSVDELRGACLRVGAAEALLITTSAFSKVVRANTAAPAGAGIPLAPVRLMDGLELTALLIQHRLGVKEGKVREGKTSMVKNLRGRKSADKKLGDKQWEIDEHWEIDETFFAELALASAILSKEAPTESHKPTQRQEPTTPSSTPVQSTTPAKDLLQWRVTLRISSSTEGKKADDRKEIDRKEANEKGGG